MTLCHHHHPGASFFADVAISVIDSENEQNNI